METQLGAYKFCLKILLVNTSVLLISATYRCTELNSSSSDSVIKNKSVSFIDYLDFFNTNIFYPLREYDDTKQ